MTDSKKLLVAALAPLLKARGYKKKAATWHLTEPETVLTFNVQQSQWSMMFYLNLGVYLRSIGDETQPAESSCHIRTRLSALVPDRARLIALLDFDKVVPGFENTDSPLDSRLHEITEAVNVHGLSWLDSLTSLDRITAFLRSDKAKKTLISQPLLRRVYDKFELPYPWP